MSDIPPRLWHWPDRRHLGEAARLALLQGLWFGLVFYGADYVASLHSFRIRVHFDFDIAVPFVPQAVVVYDSLYLLFAIAPFILGTRRELRAMTATLAAVTLIAGVCFLLLPVKDAFPPPGKMGLWTGPVHLAKLLAASNNYFPSLHVTLSTTCAAVYARHAHLLGKLLFTLWSAAVGVSTLLLHQHYSLDVVAGFALALGSVRWIYVPLATGSDGS